MNTHVFQSAGELHSQVVVNFPRNTLVVGGDALGVAGACADAAVDNQRVTGDE
jgi:hypothetical protein